jgi:cysteine-S-conjugate beta-lyase
MERMGGPGGYSGGDGSVTSPKGTLRDATRLLHSGTASEPLLRTVGPPIQKGSTVLLPNAAALYDETRPTYGRHGLATHEALIEALAVLEHATSVSLFPSGIAALTGAMLAVLKAGDEVLVTDAIYRPTRRFCDRVLRRYGIGVTYYPPRAAADDLMALAGPATRLIVMESPGSLTMELADTPAIAGAARARGILTLMDNTWAAGLYFRPLDHGVDISVQALTKYVGGHSDVFMGSAAVADAALAAALDQGVLDFGWAVSPEDAYMMLRGLRTLPTRLARHQESALTVAAWLAGQPAVGQVWYPPLTGAQDHDLWKRDFTGAAGLFSFVLEGADAVRKDRFLDALRLFGLGFSWGGFESLAVDCDPQFGVRKTAPQFSGPLIRLSIGLEDPADLIADLHQALAASA